MAARASQGPDQNAEHPSSEGKLTAEGAESAEVNSHFWLCGVSRGSNPTHLIKKTVQTAEGAERKISSLRPLRPAV